MRSNKILSKIFGLLIILAVVTSKSCTKTFAKTEMKTVQSLIPNEQPFQLVSKSVNKCIQGNVGQGNGVNLVYCAIGNPTLNWLRISYTDGSYAFLNQASNFVFEIACGATNNGAGVREWPEDDNSEQKFNLSPTADGYIQLQALNSQKCISVNGGSGLSQQNCGGDDTLWKMRVLNIVLPTSWTNIQITTTGKCLSSSGFNSALIQDDCKMDPNQSFTFVLNSDGTYTIIAGHGLAIDNYWGGSNNGNAINTWQLNWSDAQKWYLDQVDDTYLTFSNKSANKCIDLPSGYTGNGIKMQLFDCLNNYTQKFTLIPTGFDRLPTGWIQIQNKQQTNTCIKLIGRNSALQNLPCTDYDSTQAFMLMPNADGSYFIRTINNLMFDDYYWNTNNGAQVYSYDQTGNANQKWWITPIDNEYFELINFNSNKCIDVGTSPTVYQWDCNSTNYQFFHFALIDLLPLPDTYFTIINKFTGKCVQAKQIYSQLTEAPCSDTDQSLAFKSNYNSNDNTYQFQHSSRMVMDLYYGNTNNLTPIKIWEPSVDGGNTNQKWYFIPINQTDFMIMHFGDLKCFDLNNASANDGTVFQLYDCYNLHAQVFNWKEIDVTPVPALYVTIMNYGTKNCVGSFVNSVYEQDCALLPSSNVAWQFNQNSDGSYTIENYANIAINNNAALANNVDDNERWFLMPFINGFTFVNKANKMCFDLIYGLAAIGSPFQVFNCLQNNMQLYTLTSIAVTSLPTGLIIIRNSKSKNCIMYNNRNLQLSESACNAADNKYAWQLIPNSDGSYTISTAFGFVFHNQNNLSNNGNPILGGIPDSSTSTKWYIQPNGNWFSIVNYDNHKCVDRGNPTTFIQLWDCAASNDNQQWYFEASTVAPLPTSWVQIQYNSTNFCIKYIGIYNNLTLGPCSDLDGSIAWRLVPNGDGTFVFTSWMGIAFDNYYSQSNNGNPIKGWQNTGNNVNQNWYLYPSNQSQYKILNTLVNKCVDVPYGSTNPGVIMQIYDCNYTSNKLPQNYNLVPMDVNILPTGSIQIVSKSSLECLKYNGTYTTIVFGDCGATDGSVNWTLTPIQGDTAYVLISKSSGKAFDNYNGNSNNGNAINAWDTDPNGAGINQTWYIYPNDSLYYKFINKRVNKCIDIPGGDPSYNIQLYDCILNDDFQLFYFK